MNSSRNTFYCIILLNSFCFMLVSSETSDKASGQIAHYAFRQAEQLLKGNQEYNPNEPFLESLSLCPSALAHTYALFCGEAPKSTMLLSKRKNEEYKQREQLKKIAQNIVYLRLNKAANNGFSLGEHSEYEKLLHTMKDKRNDYTFCIVFNNPDNESSLHVAQVEQKNTVLSTTFFSPQNKKIDDLPEYMAFIDQIVADETELKSTIKRYLCSYYSYDVAHAELARLSCISFLTRLWSFLSFQSLPSCLGIYIVAMVCYKYFLRGMSISECVMIISHCVDCAKDIAQYITIRNVVALLFIGQLCCG